VAAKKEGPEQEHDAERHTCHPKQCGHKDPAFELLTVFSQLGFHSYLDMQLGVVPTVMVRFATSKPSNSAARVVGHRR
jgi:hypothetical protein